MLKFRDEFPFTMFIVRGPGASSYNEKGSEGVEAGYTPLLRITLTVIVDSEFNVVLLVYRCR